MTVRDWHRTFSDPVVLADLEAALRQMAAELDDCDPEECLHPEQRVHPFEVLTWIQDELRMAGKRPMRFEPGHRPRRMKHETRTMATAG